MRSYDQELVLQVLNELERGIDSHSAVQRQCLKLLREKRSHQRQWILELKNYVVLMIADLKSQKLDQQDQLYQQLKNRLINL